MAIWLAGTAIRRARRGGTAGPRGSVVVIVIGGVGVLISCRTAGWVRAVRQQALTFTQCLSGANTIAAQQTCQTQFMPGAVENARPARPGSGPGDAGARRFAQAVAAPVIPRQGRSGPGGCGARSPRLSASPADPPRCGGPRLRPRRQSRLSARGPAPGNTSPGGGETAHPVPVHQAGGDRGGHADLEHGHHARLPSGRPDRGQPAAAQRAAREGREQRPGRARWPRRRRSPTAAPARPPGWGRPGRSAARRTPRPGTARRA